MISMEASMRTPCRPHAAFPHAAVAYKQPPLFTMTHLLHAYTSTCMWATCMCQHQQRHLGSKGSLPHHVDSVACALASRHPFATQLVIVVARCRQPL